MHIVANLNLDELLIVPFAADLLYLRSDTSYNAFRRPWKEVTSKSKWLTLGLDEGNVDSRRDVDGLHRSSASTIRARRQTFRKF